MTDETQPVRLEIDGMHCSSCVAHVEDAINSVDGVLTSSVSLADSTAEVNGSSFDVEQITKAVRDAGYQATLIASQQSIAEERESLERRVSHRATRWRWRVQLGFALWIPLAVVHWFGNALGIPTELLATQWAIAAVASVAFFTVGWAFFSSALDAARARSANMDTLVSIGASAAWGFSLVELIMRTMGEGQAPLYFVEAAGLLAFIALGHWLEARTTATAGDALRSLLALQPDDIERLATLDAQEGERVASSLIEVGDLILVRPGDRIAVDGEIASGASTIDEAAVTGEPIPVDRGSGDSVIAGTLNTTGRLVVRATTDGRSTTLTRMADIVRKAQASKSKLQRTADRVAGVFVPIVLVIAVLTFGGWWIFGGENSLTHAILNAVTVLVIACPCALGLATPTAVMAGSGAASRNGILIRSAEAMERAAAVQTVAFDKTGTLTQGKPVVDAADDETLALAAAIAIGSAHPLSQAILQCAIERGLTPPIASAMTETPGRGVYGVVDGAAIELLAGEAVRAEGKLGSLVLPDARTTSVVLQDGNAVGAISFVDRARPEAAALITSLQASGKVCIILSGDRESVVKELGVSIGIAPENAFGGLTPEGKVNAIRARTGGVAMVGDGINDAGALAEAGALGGVGIAVGTGTNIAIESADIVIPGERLDAIEESLRVAYATRRTIRENLALSFLYNSCAIPIAAAGLLGAIGPLVAGAAMGMSSVSVVSNSLRLRWRLRRGVSKEMN